jgi:hypothetical protein
MLQVIDSQTGQTVDVRTILDIKENDIKDEKLKDQLSKIENQSIAGESNLNDYFSKLDTFAEFDMGKFEEEEVDDE